VAAKAALAAWALAGGTPLVTVGAAGGKRAPQRVELADLADVTHDPLLAALRQRLRQRARRAGEPVPGTHGARGGTGRFGLDCVFSREPMAQPEACGPGEIAAGAPLACAGYGSSVTVTATFGLVAVAAGLERLLARPAGGTAGIY
jgi:tRNA A37 threonylcarbamoyladenosine dehydratase